MKNGLIIYENGDKCWYKNGLLHNENGPAVKFTNGSKFWYYEGEKIFCKTQKEFKQLIKLKVLW